MTSKDKLSEFIEALTPAQMEKLVNHLPGLTSLLEVSYPPFPPAPDPQTPEAPAC